MEFSAGLYAPHLRTELWRNLIRAEAIADQQTPGALVAARRNARLRRGRRRRIAVYAPEYQALVKPSDGGTLAALDFRRTESTLINSILQAARAVSRAAERSELSSCDVNGSRVRADQGQGSGPGAVSSLRSLGAPRVSLFLFDPARTHADYEALQLHEGPEFAGGAFHVE